MMTERAANRLKALILVLLAIFFAQKLVSGDLYYYIGPRFGWLSILAVVLLIAFAGAYNFFEQRRKDDEHTGHHHHHDHAGPVWSLVVVALPLVLGVVIPARPLDASAINSRGVTTEYAGSLNESDQVLSTAPTERNVLDWVRAMAANPDPAALNGQQADLIGFIYRDIRFSEDQFMVARFTISCCVADATAIGVVVAAPDASRYEVNSWVRVTGTFAEGALDGDPIPVLLPDEIIQIEQPEQPYLFP